MVKSEIGQLSKASILIRHAVIATIQRQRTGDALLVANDGAEWKMTQRVDGELRPFSMLVESIRGAEIYTTPEIVLKIRSHLFFHNGKMYMLSNVPEGRTQHHAMKGPRFISRLDNFPYEDPSKVDPETQNRLRRFRGVPVGEISGLGQIGHRVRIEPELEDIGLPLSASAFLLYTTGSAEVEMTRAAER
ncbi:MAG: hypothetical protein ACRECH_08720 [Nitrososphaerales archaeon]